jgi:hypothetical protein
MSLLHQLAVEPMPGASIAKSGPAADTRSIAPQSCCPFPVNTAGPHLHPLVGSAHFENFPNIFCKPPLPLAGVFTYLPRLSLNFIFPPQIKPFVAYNSPLPARKSSK